jgi:glycosyltransferase involved in cell wall biosynthesis
MKIVLLSTSQPATNPRLLKEADALSRAGHVVKAYCTYVADWAYTMDRRLMQLRTWSLEYVGGIPTGPRWYWSRLRFLLARRRLGKDGHARFGPREWALSRTTPELVAAARKEVADVYIGHNLGALPAVVAGARQNGGRALFDLEDAYTDMGVDGSHQSSWDRLLRRIEDAYIPACDALTAASDGIGRMYRERFHVSPITILNTFPLEWGVDGETTRVGQSLRLFWFSQTIGPDRGLQDIVCAMARLKHEAIELHLLGRWQPGFESSFLADARSRGLDVERQIHSYAPMFPEEIVRFAASFDVGLALEVPSSRNRQVCLTNKIFTYLLAGKAIIATETDGQRTFFEELPEVGYCYPSGDVDALVEKLETLASDRELLAYMSEHAIAAARARYNWNVESCKLLDLIAEVGADAAHHEAA